jgi:hypothetical protein
MSSRELFQTIEEEDLDRETVPGQQTKKQRGNWTAEQDEALRVAVEKYEGKRWRQISDEVPGGRTHIQCLQRWQKVLKPGLVKGPWKAEEDELLRTYVPLEAKGNWVGIAVHVPGRTAKQCRERWYLCVDPTIRRDPWSAEEDELLLKLHREFGNGWALISQQLPGRTENAVKSRFKSLERKVEKRLQKEKEAPALALALAAEETWRGATSQQQRQKTKKKTKDVAKRTKSKSSSAGIASESEITVFDTEPLPLLSDVPVLLDTPSALGPPRPLSRQLGPSALSWSSDRKELAAIRHLSSDQLHGVAYSQSDSFENWLHATAGTGLDDSLLRFPEADEDDSFDTFFGRMHGDSDFSMV